MVAESTSDQVVDSTDKLLNRLVVLSRPVDRYKQDVEETNKKLLNVLDEALSSKIIDDEKLREILETMQHHFETVREEIESAPQELKNLWKLHQAFCNKLFAIFSEKRESNQKP